jgi:hypothetical protein
MNITEARYWVQDVYKLDWLEFIKDFGVKDHYNRHAVTVWVNIQARVI